MSRGQTHGDGSMGPMETLKTGATLGIFAVRAMRFPHAVYFTRLGTWGHKLVGLPETLGAIFFVPLTVLIGQGTNGLRWLNYYWLGIFVMLLLHRLAGMVRRACGTVIHSQYIGDSLMSLCFPSWRPYSWRNLEWMAALVIGPLLIGLCPTLGACVIISATANALFVSLLVEKENRSAQNAIDSQLEAAAFSARVREMRGEP